MNHRPPLIEEPARRLPVAATHDVVVCGGGPAGVAAAIAAARAGADTCLVEAQGCLGGVWTSGLLSIILDGSNKTGLMPELRERLRAMGAIQPDRDLYEAEAMKVLLEELCESAGVKVRLYTRLAAAQTQDRRLRHLILEAKEGRFALGARQFIDTTGDGDLGAMAGCGFDLGRPQDGLTQPMTLMALIANVPQEARHPPLVSPTSPYSVDKKLFYRKLCEAGAPSSYTCPSLFRLPNGTTALMIHHAYECSALDARDLTRASIEGRREIRRVVAAMKAFPGEGWRNVELVTTAAHIGVREGRRIHGDYRIDNDDVSTGRQHPDAVARATFGVDVHSVRRSEGGSYGHERIPHLPYDIPLRALIARDLDNLFLAGRCISGSFFAHASYRVTGNAVATGEAAGKAAAYAALKGCSPRGIPFEEVFGNPRSP
ncbi:MAG TPA: FAD-dependent oxidoreductase [Chthoniobacteraceae bacterium]|nr:FAD-dependent oxidoreductase [Chthoniobacteraceae bacterium]